MVGEDPMSRLLLHKFPVSLLLLSLTGCTCDGIDDGVWTFQEPWAEDVYTEPDTLAPSAADSPGGEPETDAGSAEPEPVRMKKRLSQGSFRMNLSTSMQGLG
jgi:hypothetical protein